MPPYARGYKRPRYASNTQGRPNAKRLKTWKQQVAAVAATPIVQAAAAGLGAPAAGLAAAGLHAAMRSTNSYGTQTSARKVKSFRSYARLSGFVRKGRRMNRKMKRRYKKAFGGIEFCEERVFNITDNRCVYIAHHSQPVMNVAKMMAYALFKRLLNHAGVQFSSWSDTALGIITTADVIGLEYKITPVAGTAASTWTAPTVTIATTLGSLAELFWLHIRDNFLRQGANIANIGSQFRLTKIYWLEAGTNRNKDQIQLADAKFSCMIKSTLKMQNRSIATTDDDESTDVNNVPLTGRSYDFKGNMMIPRDNAMGDGLAIFTTPDNEVGISIIGALAVTALQEPPSPYFFATKPKTAKQSLQPGDIKTSVINDRINVNISSFFRFVNGILRGNASYSQLYNPLGKSRMFAFERVIARLGSEIEPGIVVTTEVDIKFWAEVRTGSGQYTGPLNIVF